MHIDFRNKLNKTDSLNEQNIRLQDIDFQLNLSQNILVKLAAFPRRFTNYFGLSINQRSLDDIRTIVYNSTVSASSAADAGTPERILADDRIVRLPNDYWFYLRGDCQISNSACTDGQKARLYIQQYDDEFQSDPFTRSSFGWRHVNGTFFNQGIQLYNNDGADDEFNIQAVTLTYLKQPREIRFRGDGGVAYSIPGKTLGTADNIDCELPSHLHDEIVTLAVYNTTLNIKSDLTQFKQGQLVLNEIPVGN